MTKKESCDPKYVLQNIEVIKGKTDKLAYIGDTIARCGTTAPTKRKKGVISGYNCFTKVQVRKTGEPLIKVVKAKSWSTFDNNQKTTWKHHASEGCPPRLWGG